MTKNNEFDWVGISAMLKEIVPQVLRSFPRHVLLDSDDIGQDVLLKLHRSGYSESPGHKLLAVIVKHEAIDRIRAGRRVGRLEGIDVVDSTEDKAATHEHRAELWRLLKKGLAELSEKDRVLLMKFYWGRMKIQELADQAGVGYSAMAVRLYRIKEELRHVLSRPAD